ncbi:MATE family efflux transporter, partial [[Clostridium] scindens]|uniref:MATE family efflux transporter n=1 Tax=Clostridium scindens (strain JCM 10418 / VPI 12708) TaxID=29347 RepID=UPI0034A5B6F0
LILALIVGGLATLVAPLSGVILPLLGADAGIAPLGIAYLGALFPFSCAFMLNNVLVCFMRNAGHPRLAMAAMLVGSLSNILLDYLFLFPLGWGMAGAAAATGLAPCLGILTLAPVCLGKKSPLRLCRPHLTVGKIKHLLSPGLPSLVNEASVALVMALFNSIILGLAGNPGVAAYGIVANLALVATAMLTGVAQGIQPLISRAYGAGDCAAILQARRIAMVTALIFGDCLRHWHRSSPPSLPACLTPGRMPRWATWPLRGCAFILPPIPLWALT